MLQWVAPPTSMYSMKRTSAPTRPRVLDQVGQLVVVDPAHDHGVELEPRPAARPDRRDALEHPGVRVAPGERRKRSARRVSRLTVTRWSPAARSAGACSASSTPLVVRARSRSRGLPASRRTSRSRSRRSSGSPPVRRTLSTPRSVKTSTSWAISSKVSTSLAGQPDVLLLGHAVLAAQVAAVGDGQAQVAKRAIEGVPDHGSSTYTSPSTDPGREAGDLDRRVVGVGSGGHVPAPAVPRADGEAAVEVAVAHRPTPVRAGVVDHVVGAVDVEEREALGPGLHHEALPDRHVGGLRDLDGRHGGPTRLTAAGAAASQARSHSRRRPAFFTPTSKWSHGMISATSRTRRVKKAASPSHSRSARRQSPSSPAASSMKSATRRSPRASRACSAASRGFSCTTRMVSSRRAACLMMSSLASRRAGLVEGRPLERRPRLRHERRDREGELAERVPVGPAHLQALEQPRGQVRDGLHVLAGLGRQADHEVALQIRDAVAAEEIAGLVELLVADRPCG